MPFQDQNFNLRIEGKMTFWGNIHRQRRQKRYWMHLSDETLYILILKSEPYVTGQDL